MKEKDTVKNEFSQAGFVPGKAQAQTQMRKHNKVALKAARKWRVI